MNRKLIALILCVAMLLCLPVAFAEEAAVEHTEAVVLFTNDVHCAIDATMGYSAVMAYKKAFEASGCEVALVDSGDAIQGGPIGTLSKGEYIVDIMNYMGYVASAVGNHEFDYGLDRLLELKDKAQYSYLAANFTDLEGNAIFDSYKMIELGGWKIAFIGMSTPETFTSSTPTYFQNDEGEFIYSFKGGQDPTEFYADAQKAVDLAKADGADFIIALTHLGILDVNSPYNSNDLIMNTTGISCVLDGHSHSIIEGEYVKNAAGEDVLLASTGTKLVNLGELRISTEGALTTKLHSETIFKDAETDEFISGIKAQYGETLATVIGTTPFDLVIYDPETEARIVRTSETNLGDLCADAYRIVSGADVAIVNGGGVRANIASGDMTYEAVLNVHPFGNAMCVAEVTGQQILDALEMGVRNFPEENGGFWQISGMSYQINTAIPTSVVLDENGLFKSVDGDYRVTNLMIGENPVDLTATYTLAGNDYHIKNSGDGMAMFAGCTLLQDSVMLDNQVLITYVTENLGGVIPETYANPYGEGRITALAE